MSIRKKRMIAGLSISFWQRVLSSSKVHPKGLFFLLRRSKSQHGAFTAMCEYADGVFSCSHGTASVSRLRQSSAGAATGGDGRATGTYAHTKTPASSQKQKKRQAETDRNGHGRPWVWLHHSHRSRQPKNKDVLPVVRSSSHRAGAGGVVCLLFLRMPPTPVQLK